MSDTRYPVTPQFQAQVAAMARRLATTPDALMQTMDFETRGTFDPAVRNQAGSGATGLIQFLPPTARALGTTTDQLARMSAEEQLPYVERYLRPFRGRLRTPGDVQLAVLYPAALGKPQGTPLFRQGTRAYAQNAMLDTEQKGVVTVADATRARSQFVGRTLGPRPRAAATVADQLFPQAAPPAAPTAASPGDGPALADQFFPPSASAPPPPPPPAEPTLAPVVVQAERADGPQRPWWQQFAAGMEGTDPLHRPGLLTQEVLPPAEAQALRESQQAGDRAAAGAAASSATSSAATALGTTLGTVVAPFAGPLAPLLPYLGGLAGAYAGRRANVALGLEDAGRLGDALSVALPAGSGIGTLLRQVRAPVTVPAKAQPLVGAAHQAQVPLTYGEAMQQPLTRKIETHLDQVPGIGTAGFRQRQHDALKAAGARQEALRAEVMGATPWDDLARVERAAARGNKQAQQVLEQVANAGDDWTKIVQTSGNLQAWKQRQLGERLYQEVAVQAEGLGPVPLTTTLATLDETLQQLRTAVVPDTDTIRYLTQLKQGLQSQTETTVSPLLDASGHASTRTVTTPGKTSYGQLRQLRSDLGDTISDYYRGGHAVVGAKGVGSLARVRTALEQDLDTFTQHSPHPTLAAAARKADVHWQSKVLPYADTQLAKALTSETPDEIYGKFIQRGHRDRAQRFYNALDTRGKAAVQYGMVAEAQQAAVDPTRGTFSPARFATSLERIQEARGVFFRGEEAQKLDGLLKVMRAAERAGSFAENPPTGNRLIPLLLGGGLVAGSLTHVPATVGAVAATRGLSWLLASKAGTRLLLQARAMRDAALSSEAFLGHLETQLGRAVMTAGAEAALAAPRDTAVTVEPRRIFQGPPAAP